MLLANEWTSLFGVSIWTASFYNKISVNINHSSQFRGNAAKQYAVNEACALVIAVLQRKTWYSESPYGTYYSRKKSPYYKISVNTWPNLDSHQIRRHRVFCSAHIILDRHYIGIKVSSDFEIYQNKSSEHVALISSILKVSSET